MFVLLEKCKKTLSVDVIQMFFVFFVFLSYGTCFVTICILLKFSKLSLKYK